VAENAERRVTPHLAWLTGETLERSRAVIAENCRRLLCPAPAAPGPAHATPISLYLDEFPLPKG